VGFLFPHPCERQTPEGCPDCQNGQIADPYGQRVDRYTYTDYDDYGDNALAAYGTAGAITQFDDFTEADGETLIKPRDMFEDDMSAS
jgi:hypothetical protein